ncbi:MAG: hypothetical protein LIP12_01275, partial [Clostridiales bacterium]|nr:hypothetical protein [Clostridiales bacterium]
MAMVFQQAGITTLADDGTTLAAETAVTENVTEAAEINSDNTSDTEAAEPATSASAEETTADTTAVETSASSVTETEAETAAAAEAESGSGTNAESTSETDAAPATEADTTAASGDDAAQESSETSSNVEETPSDNTQNENNNTTEAVTENVTEAVSDAATAETTEAAAKSENASESTAESEAQTETAAEAGEAEDTTEAEAATEAETSSDSEAETSADTESESESVTEAVEDETSEEAETEAETEAAAEAETEIETEAATEVETETETETEAPKTSFTYSDSRVVITATASEEANLPQDAELKADYIEPGSDEYNEAVSKIESQLGSELGLNEENVETAYVMYDVYFLSNGEEVEPEAGTVSVSMVFRSAVDLGLTGEIVDTEVVHVTDSGEAEVVTDYVNVNANGDVTAMGFTQDSFSTEVLLGSSRAASTPVNLTDIVQDMTITVTDINGNEITANNPLGRDDSFYIVIDYEILNAYKNSIANETNITYTLPNTVSVDYAVGYVTSKVDNSIIGFYTVVNNVLTFYLYDSFLENNSDITGTFTITASANTEEISNTTSTTFMFPGTGTYTTLYFEDGSVEGSKTYVQNDDGTITFTIKLVLDADVTDLVLSDELGSNFSFVDGSFALNGSSSGVSTSINGQTATVTIGSLSMGTYYITYDVNVTDEIVDNIANKNTASWTWKFNNNSHKNDTSSTVDMTKSWINKSGSKNSSGSDTRVDWTITVNGGNYRGNLKGKVITDTIGSGQTVDYSTIKVTDSSGTDCTSSVTISQTVSGFTVTFPDTDDYGKYTITYQTIVDANSTALSVTNNATTTDDDGTEVTATGSAQVKGILDKENTAVDNDAFTATWKAVIDIDSLTSGSTISNVTFSDYLNYGQGSFDENSIKVEYEDGTPLDSTAYTVAVDNRSYAAYLTITFNVELSKNVVITYKTVYDKDSASSGTNSYYNGAEVDYTYEGKTYEDEDYDTCELIKTVYISKKDTTFTWDSDVNAYVATWEITVNPNGDDYGTNNYTVIDTLPSGLEYISGSSDVYNWTEWYHNYDDPTISGLTLTYTLTNIGTKTYTIKYKTKVTDTTVISRLLNGESVSYSNTVTIKQGNTEKGSDTAEGSISNSSFLSKEFSQYDNTIGGNTTNVTYTIKVNADGVDLDPNGTTITVEDYLDEILTLATDSITVTNGKTNAALSSTDYTVSYNSATRLLSFTIPDATYVIITFEATPNDPTATNGSWIRVSNSVSLSGTVITATTGSKEVQVVESTASAGGSAKSITIKKISESLTPLSGAEFELYRVTYTMESGVYVFSTDVNGDFNSVLVDTQTTDEKGVLTFSYDPYSSDEKLQSDVLYYYVETKAPNGYEVDSTKTYFVLPGNSYSLIESALSTLNFTNWHSFKGGQTVDVTNEKDLTTNVQFGGTKTINGLPNGVTSNETFTFKLTEITNSGSTELETVTTTGEGSFRFTSINYKTVGTHTYTITEETGNAQGYSYSDANYTVTVEVTDDGSGQLTATVTGLSADQTTSGLYTGANFTNTYTAGSTNVQFGGTKTINGLPNGVTSNETFTFKLTEITNSGSTELETVTTTGEGSFRFTSINYKTVGTHTYTITEETGNAQGYSYSDANYTVTVEVTDDGSGQLTAAVTGLSADQTTSGLYTGANFTNIYTASGSLSLEAAKTLTTTETPLTTGQFTFTVEGDHLTAAVAATNGADGKVTFTNVDSYNENDAGKTYTYTVKEVDDGDAGYTYDDTVYTVTVKVVDNGDGTLSTEKSIVSSKSGAVEAMTFSNKYTTAGQIVLEATKTLTGRTLAADQFSFTITEVDATGAVAANGYTATVKNTAGGSITFPVISYEKSGTYYYKITETNDGQSGYGYDSSVYTVTVKVTDDEKGSLNAVVAGIDKDGVTADAVVFSNTYTATGSLDLEATKTLTTAETPLTAGQFEFTVEGGKLKAAVTATNDADGKVTFANVDGYDETDAGKTYTYTVKEVNDGDAGYTYDDTVYTVTVKVADNGDGTLNVEKSIVSSKTGAVSAMAFSNTYAADGQIVLEATKTLSGRTLEDGQFTFAITEVNAAGEAVAGGYTASAANNAGGTITFPVIKYAQSGTYYYQISEVNGGQNGYAYDESVYTVTVTVTDNKAGSLKAEVTGIQKNGETAVAVAFENTYTTADAELILKASKAMSRTDIELGTFEFELKDADGNVLETVKNDTAGSINFSALTYTQSDIGKTFTYTVSEKTQTGTGYLYDDTIYTVTVEVADNGDGTLKLTTTVDGKEYTDTAMTFTNDITSVKISKVDVTTEEELPG